MSSFTEIGADAYLTMGLWTVTKEIIVSGFKIFVKHTSPFILGACFFVYLINVLGAR